MYKLRSKACLPNETKRQLVSRWMYIYINIHIEESYMLNWIDHMNRKHVIVYSFFFSLWFLFFWFLKSSGLQSHGTSWGTVEGKIYQSLSRRVSVGQCAFKAFFVIVIVITIIIITIVATGGLLLLLVGLLNGFVETLL